MYYLSMPNNFFNGEEMLEAGQSLVKNAGDQVAKQTSITANTAVNQLTGPGTNETQTQTQGNQQGDTAKDFVKDLYGVNNSSTNTTQTSGVNNPNGQKDQQPQSPEEAMKLAEARKLLQEQHMNTYWKPTFEPQKREEEPEAEKVEREKQEEEAKKMEKLQEEQKKNEVPLAIRMASQKTEKFPGASG
jgi:hypothetical protein